MRKRADPPVLSYGTNVPSYRLRWGHVLAPDVLYNFILAGCKTLDRGYGERFGALLIDLLLAPVGNLVLIVVGLMFCMVPPVRSRWLLLLRVLSLHAIPLLGYIGVSRCM